MGADQSSTIEMSPAGHGFIVGNGLAYWSVYAIPPSYQALYQPYYYGGPFSLDLSPGFYGVTSGSIDDSFFFYPGRPCSTGGPCSFELNITSSTGVAATAPEPASVLLLGTGLLGLGLVAWRRKEED